MGGRPILLLGFGVLLGQGKLCGGVTCYCDGHCPDNAPNGTCVGQPGAQCFSAVEEVWNAETGETEPERTYGCLPPDERGFMQCKGHLVPHLQSKSIMCCNYTDLCNKYLAPEYVARPSAPDAPDDFDQTLPFVLLSVSISVCLIAFFITVAYVYLRYKKREDRRQLYLLQSGRSCDALIGPAGTLSQLIEQSSGSGSGLPLLVQRTIAKQIQMSRAVGRGRYGEVWLARWRGERVAVKVFFTAEEASWFRETEIYQTVLMRHENILGFIAADIKGSAAWTQMLLITEYHERGSLHDYLQTHALDAEALRTLAASAAAGVAHLHTEIFGTRGKPAIAHRDLKSKNILVKRDGQCAIADFGLAVRYISDSNEIDVAPSARVGTRRYMAPEVLDRSLCVSSFDAFKAADMYALALVFWEMCRRCATGDKLAVVDDYQQPYYDCVPADPGYEEMYQVVCVKKIRPLVPPRWETEPILLMLSKIMQECWHPNPTVRLTSLRVKKSLGKLDSDLAVKIV